MADNPQPILSFTHDEQVSAITFHPNGRQLAAIANQTLCIYDLTPGAAPTVVATDVELFAVAYAPTGTTVAVSGFGAGVNGPRPAIAFDPVTGSQRWRKTSVPSIISGFSADASSILVRSQKSAQLLDAATGTPRWNFDAQQGQTLYRGEFSPDGSTVAIGTGQGLDSGEIVFVGTSDGAVRKRVGRPSPVRALSFSRTGRFVAFGADREIGILDTTSQALRVLPNPVVPHHGDRREVLRIVFSGDDRLLGVVSVTINGINPTIQVLESDTFAVKRELPDGFAGWLEFGRDSRTVLTGETGSTARIWDVATGVDLFSYTPTDSETGISDTTLDPVGRLIAVSSDRTVRVFELPAAERLRLAHGGPVCAVGFDTDGSRVLTGSADKTARVFDLATGTPQFSITHNDAVIAVCAIPSRAWFATASTDATARIIETTTGTQRATINHPGALTALTASTDGTRLATGCTDGAARLIDPDTATIVRRLTLDDTVHAVAFNPAGTRLAVGSADGTARIYNTTTGAELLNLAHNGAVHAVAFNPAGTRLATAAADATARIFDTTTGTQLHTLPHNGPVTAVAFTTDATRLATAAADNTARIFDTTTGTQLHTLPHNGPVHAVAFTTDATRLITAAADATARIYDTTTETHPRRPRHRPGHRPHQHHPGHRQHRHHRPHLPPARITATPQDRDGRARQCVYRQLIVACGGTRTPSGGNCETIRAPFGSPCRSNLTLLLVTVKKKLPRSRGVFLVKASSW